MPEPLKNLYTPAVIDGVAEAVAAVDRRFDPTAFRARVFDAAWAERALKERMRHVATCLYTGMAGDYPQRIRRLMKIAPAFSGLPYLFFSDIVEQYGLDHWELSMEALAAFTPCCSSEFAVRPFILRDPPRMLARMRRWADHPDEQVRRLASEGARPLLPWGCALPVLRRDPSPVLPILEALRDDPSAFVRRSVANHLNDLSKDHPALVRSIAVRWLRESPASRPLVKHGCRTLLKRGDPEVLALFDCDAGAVARVVRFGLTPRRVGAGETVTLTVDVEAEGEPPPRLRIDYTVDYPTPAGGVSRRQFRLAERVVDGRAVFTRRLSLRDLSTRIHAPGLHPVRILLNGREAARGAFTLVAPARSRGG